MDSIAPPGTEDEPVVSFSTATKQEKERERLLSLKRTLPNGKYGPVYDFNYVNGTEQWYCNACACPVMGWVFHHETGKRHKQALGGGHSERHHSFQEPDETPIIMQIAPGEPAPPGIEGGHVEKLAAIQERLDVFNVGPLVALEYLLELKDYDPSKEPTYLCVLCDKKGDPRTVLTHLASYKHILQYLQKHFPTCYRALAPYMTKQYKRNWQSCLHEIAEAIEKKFGRLKPMPVDAAQYEKETVHYLEMIGKGRHFSELSGYTFEELVNKDELTKVYEDDDKFGYNKSLLPQTQQRKKSPSPPVVANPIKKIKVCNPSSAVGNRRSLSSVSSVSSSDLSDFDEPKEKIIKKAPPAGRRSRSRSRSPFRNRSRSPYARRYELGRRSPIVQRRDDRNFIRRDDRNLMPWERSNYRRSKPDSSSSDRNSRDKQDKHDEYKKLCKAIDNDMERVLKQNKKNPEKHPQYNDEWKKFWNKRYKELQSEGKDVSTHDFKPEWIEFWNGRMIELHQDEVKIKKEGLRKRLGLQEDPVIPVSFKIGGNKRKSEQQNKKPVPPSAMPDHDPEVIVIDDKDTDTPRSGSRRSHSPWEDEPAVSTTVKAPTVAPINKSSGRDNKSRERDNKSRGRGRSRTRSPVSNKDRDRDRSPGGGNRSSYARERERSYDRYSRDYRDRPRERIRIASELPWERAKYKNEIPHYYKPPAVMRDVTREPVLSPPLVPKIAAVVEEPEDDGDINIVAVLRLLTALEEKLGSLGPKVVDLLAQALAMEKAEANSSETLLDNEINCVLFETVKEKLKGSLLAGLVEPAQIRAIKRAVTKTASLIHLSEERQRERNKFVKSVNPVKVPGVGTVDKAAIAKQIANALIAQGKTDVTQAELEQLINAVVGMAEASKKLNKPMTTANFLQQINKPEPVVELIEDTSNDSQEDRPKVLNREIIPTVHKKAAAAAVKASPERVAPPPPTATIAAVTGTVMEGLSDSDLQTLLQNFKDLSTEEQHGLINYLKKLEAREPDRVERLRKFVNLGGNATNAASLPVEKEKSAPLVSDRKISGRESPFSNRTGSLNPTVDEEKHKIEDSEPVKPIKFELVKPKVIKLPIVDSDEEEDYTFEDLAKIASKNVKQHELEKEVQKKKDDLDETKAIISNIMGNINKKEVAQANLLGLGGLDFAKTLNSLPVNMANLANIVGSVQNMTNKQQQLSYVNPVGVARPGLMTPTYGGQSFNYQQQQMRPNVSYPAIPKNTVSYPNYAMYGQNQRVDMFAASVRQPQPQQRFGQPNNNFNSGRGSQFGNSMNPNSGGSYNNSNRW